MPMYNLLNFSSNYYDTTNKLWFYSINKATNYNADMQTLMFLRLSGIKKNY